MSTKETLPMESIFDEYLKESGREQLHYNSCSCEWCKITRRKFSEWQTDKLITIRTRLDAAEKELERACRVLDELKDICRRNVKDAEIASIELTKAKEANAELVKDFQWLTDNKEKLFCDVRFIVEDTRQAIHDARNAAAAKGTQ